MSIQSVNSVNFTSKTAHTKNGNEYEKTRVGKYIGMGAGAAIGAGVPAYLLYNRNYKMYLKRQLVEMRNNIMQELQKEGIKSSKMSAKTISKWLKAIPVVAGALTLLVGLGIGAIVDGAINHSRAKKADKIA